MRSSLRERIIGSPIEDVARTAHNVLRKARRVPEHPTDAKAMLNDAQTVEIARRVLRRDSNIIDIGANRGVMLRRLAAISPDGDHVAVEPLPHLAKSLRRHFPRVTVYQVALSDRAGVAQFRRVIGSDEESSLLGLGHETNERSVDVFDVAVRTLDDVAPERVDFIKLDAEEAEYLILQGADRVLRQRPYIAFELGANQQAVWDLLTSYGYTLNRLADWLDGIPAPPSMTSLRYGVTGEYFFLAAPA